MNRKSVGHLRNKETIPYLLLLYVIQDLLVWYNADDVCITGVSVPNTQGCSLEDAPLIAATGCNPILCTKSVTKARVQQTQKAATISPSDRPEEYVVKNALTKEPAVYLSKEMERLKDWIADLECFPYLRVDK